MQECIIYGAGKYGELAFKEFKDSKKILFFVDRDEKRWGDRFCGLEIKPPSVINENKDKMIGAMSRFKAN